MNFLDKMKDLVLGSDDGFEDLPDEGYEDVAVSQNTRYEPMERFEEIESYEPRKPERNKVVDFGSASKYPVNTVQKPSSGRPHVVVAKLEKFEDVGEIGKNINEKRMVVINLENVDNATTQRIIDFIYGVTFANNAELKRVAFRTYIIKPAGYDYTGGDGFDSSNMDGIIFGNN